MKIFLKNNWSEQFIYGDKDNPGLFIGREEEKNSIKSVIINNSSSAILISSVRGVGKTSFVHKVLSEINEGKNEKVYPIFVDIGHVLSDIKNKNKKRLILISLIRATYLNSEFNSNSKLKEIYEKCFGVFTEEREESNQKETKNEVSINSDKNSIDFKTVVRYISAVLVGFGISSENSIIKIVLGLLGIISFTVSFSCKKSFSDVFKNKKNWVKDNSTEYLEIEFENWIKSQKKRKIVFVIDELDKISEKISLKTIKDYKNLFTRSFAHYIFIASQKAFDECTNNGREKDAKEGGIYPTLFTHIIYLSFPKPDDLKEYLKLIFIKIIPEENTKLDELKNYLLFKSCGDFFELKKLISDISSYEGKDIYIDTKKIIKTDSQYSKVATLFNYVYKFFLKRNLKELKKYWKDNYQIQDDTLKTLNKNFGKNFKLSDCVGNQENITKLINFLISIGTLAESLDENNQIDHYYWTFKYKRLDSAPYLETDFKFNSSFKELIKTANDLDEITNNKRLSTTEILEDHDGQGLSGINLYSIYKDNLELFKNIKKANERISITAEITEKAKSVIDEQIKNVKDNFFNIFKGVLNANFSYYTDIFREESYTSTNYNISNILSPFPNLVSKLGSCESSMYGKTDSSKFLLIIKNIDESEIVQDLEVLRNYKNIFVINLISSEFNEVSYPVVYKNSIGRKSKNPLKVSNFKNIEFNDFKGLSVAINDSIKFLTNKLPIK